MLLKTMKIFKCIMKQRKTIRKNHCHAHFLRIIFRGLESLIINVPFVRNKKNIVEHCKRYWWSYTLSESSGGSEILSIFHGIV